jgi:DNA-binding LacI/PurR family transcriptional regulator
MHKRTITTNDVARLAGLNQSTVSRALSGSPLVTPETARKVRAACRKLDYIPNALARGLKTSRTFSLAVHLAGGTHAVMADPFVPAFLSGVSRQAVLGGYSVVLSYFDPAGMEIQLLNLIRGRRADGVVLTSPSCCEEEIRFLRKMNIPFVRGRHDSPLDAFSACVDIDNRHAGFQAARFLAARGHERIGLITEPEDSLVGRDFNAGVLDALTQAGVSYRPDQMKAVPITYEDACRAAAQLISGRCPPTAIVTNTPLLTLGALKAVRKSRRKVLVLGVESPLLKSMYPNQPRIVSPIKHLGRAMTETLIEILTTGRAEVSVRMLYTRIVDEKGIFFIHEPTGVIK